MADIVLPGSKIMVTRPVQPSKTPESRTVTDDGIDMEVIVVFSENADESMDMTSYPPNVEGMVTAPPVPVYPVMVAPSEETDYSKSPSVAASALPANIIKHAKTMAKTVRIFHTPLRDMDIPHPLSL